MSEIDFDIELNTILKNLNITEIFSDNADLSEFSGCDATFHVDKIIQKAYFGIDELGTLGTKGGLNIGSTQAFKVALKLPRIVVDHPFVFFVRHRASNTIIFSGRIQNPIRKK
ncbi:neuroserpin-like isoform X2 [Sitodiplosis mosellana]|uniref:neuroserpin-like isoform X2 n=1 Tax=Sitodiplosis mosellana TaxID=263140 RepID=UPI002443D3F6|nr:neuroserpin-like isoform X2 [Sitodiplosis mosellana]